MEGQGQREDRWILARLTYASTAITAGIENFSLQDSIKAAYAFAWNELCDWYLEAAKERLRAGDATAQDVPYFCLDNLFRRLHSFTPSVTDQLRSSLPAYRSYLIRAD